MHNSSSMDQGLPQADVILPDQEMNALL